MWAVLYIQSITLQGGILGMRLIMGFLAVHFGASEFELGLLAATYAAPAILFAIPIGLMIRRLRSAWVILFGVLTCVIAAFFTLLGDNIPQLLIASILLGMGQVACLLGQQTFPAEFSTGHHREKIYGHMTSAMSVGQLLGPLLATGIPAVMSEVIEIQIQLGNWVGIITLCATAGISLSLLVLSRRTPAIAEPTIHEADTSRRIGISGFWRNLIISGVVITSVDLLYTFLPAWAVNNQISVFEVGALLAVRSVFTIVSRFSLSVLISALGRKVLLMVCLFSGAIVMAALPFANFWLAFFLMMILGYALGLPQPMTIAWLVDRASPRRRASLLALRVSINKTVQVSLPVIITASVVGFGISGVFIGISLCLAVGGYSAATSGKVFDN